MATEGGKHGEQHKGRYIEGDKETITRSSWKEWGEVTQMKKQYVFDF